MPTIKIKGSSTAAAEPLTLAERELAVNVTDKKLYVGDGAAVRKIVGSLGNQEASAVAITGGSIAGITDLAVADGGTGASTAADARTNLGITATGADTTYAFRSNNLSDLASASTARTNLGLGSIATQASSSVSITGGSITGVTDIAIADGGTGASTAADARTNLGLGSIATQSASSVSITGGTISGITDLAVADGGTGASTAADARTNLSVPSTTGSGASGTWDISITGNAATATSATSATTATNLAGGAANRVPYQSASGTTTFVAAPTVTNSYLKWNGTALGWDTVSGGGGGGTPGGSNTQVQFNDGGSFGGDSGLTYDKTTDILTVAGSFNGPHNGTVGAATPNTGAFTTLSASSTVSGSGFSTYLASPPAIGGTAAAAGSFTTLSASSTVSGTGFSTYLASPPAIGGTAAAAGTFTTLTANGNTTLGDATTDTITLTGTVQPGVVISGSSSGDALRITQTGAGNALLVEDSANPDSTPFVVTAAGDVGIGTTSPSHRLVVQQSNTTAYAASSGSLVEPAGGANTQITNTGTGGFASLRFAALDGSYAQGYLAFANSGGSATGYFALGQRTGASSYAEQLRLDSSGNLGLGVTPSAWATVLPVLQANNASFTGYNNQAILSSNWYYNAGNKYIASGYATQYSQSSGQHIWYTAPSGFGYGTAATSLTSTQNGNSYTIVSAGTTDFTLIGAANNNVGTTFTKSGGTGAGTGTVSQNITFTQAMTLDASGNLLVRATTPYIAAFSGITVQGATSGTGNNLSLGLSKSGTPQILNGDVLGNIYFYGVDNDVTAGNNNIGAQIAAVATTDWTTDGTTSNAALVFYTHGTTSGAPPERARITSGGYFKASNNGSYVNSTSSVHEFCNNANGRTIDVYNSNASLADVLQFSVAERAASTAYNFYIGRSGGTTGDTEFTLRGDGNAYADGTWNNNGADYAEYFESANGQALTLGASVVLDNNKVREATSQDLPSAIIGVVRPKEPSKASMVVGNTAWNKWANKYLTDDFDRYIMEDHDVVEWEEHILEREAIAGVEAVIDDEGNEISPSVPAQEAVYRTKQHSYESHNIPAGVTVPGDAIRKTHDDKGNKFQHYKLNPAWDKDAQYINRENRPEWNIIGLVGQVKVLKGQPVNDRWIKMRDVSANVEEWFIR